MIIASERDRQVLERLISQVKETAFIGTYSQLSGVHKTNVNSLAKVLKLYFLAQLALTSKIRAKKQLKTIQKLLTSRVQRGSEDGSP